MSLKENKCLLLPGPVYIPQRVLQAMSQQMMDRRGVEFQSLLEEVTENLKLLFETGSDVLLFPGSGTGGLELAIANTLSPGDHVLALTAGVFSERFATIAETMGMNVHRLSFPLHEGVDPLTVKTFLEKDTGKKIKAVLVTHNETSTGVLNDIKTLGEIVKDHGSLLLVDAVSSLGGTPIKADEWNLDIVISASQKGLFAAPGLAMVSVSPRAWQFIDSATTPCFFFDLRQARQSYFENRMTPYTSAMTTLYGLRESLRIVLEEGVENVYTRHRVMANALREGIRSLGLELFVSDEKASPTVTTLVVPENLDGGTLRKTLREKYHVHIAGGMGTIASSTLRIGHLGYVGRGDILNVLSALELTLQKHGFSLNPGAAVATAQKVLARTL